MRFLSLRCLEGGWSYVYQGRRDYEVGDDVLACWRTGGGVLLVEREVGYCWLKGRCGGCGIEGYDMGFFFRSWTGWDGWALARCGGWSKLFRGSRLVS